MPKRERTGTVLCVLLINWSRVVTTARAAARIVSIVSCEWISEARVSCLPNEPPAAAINLAGFGRRFGGTLFQIGK